MNAFVNVNTASVTLTSLNVILEKIYPSQGKLLATVASSQRMNAVCTTVYYCMLMGDARGFTGDARGLQGVEGNG